MGRPPKVLTQEEIDDKKQRYWGAARNDARRAKYARDKSFREGERARMRVHSRESRDVYDPRTRIPELASLAVQRDVFADNGEVATMACFTTEEVADLLERKTQALYRWRSSGKFPHGRFNTKVGITGTVKQVYTVAETEAILNVFGAHFVETPYYHEAHEETRSRLFAAIDAAR